MRGVTRVSFCAIYYAWIDHVAKKFEVEMNQDLVTLCFSLSLMGRKALASASHQGNAQDPVRPELFLHGLHSLFQVLKAIFIQGYLTPTMENTKNLYELTTSHELVKSFQNFRLFLGIKF